VPWAISHTNSKWQTAAILNSVKLLTSPDRMNFFAPKLVAGCITWHDSDVDFIVTRLNQIWPRAPCNSNVAAAVRHIDFRSPKLDDCGSTRPVTRGSGKIFYYGYGRYCTLLPVSFYVVTVSSQYHIPDINFSFGQHNTSQSVRTKLRDDSVQLVIHNRTHRHRVVHCMDPEHVDELMLFRSHHRPVSQTTTAGMTTLMNN